MQENKKGRSAKQFIQDNIDEIGWSVVTSILDKHDNLSVTYSIGLNDKYNASEVVVIGLDPRVAAGFLNLYIHLVKEGNEFKPGKDYSEFAEGFDTRFKEVSTIDCINFMPQAYYYYQSRGKGVQAMYLVFPDSEGKWANESDHELFKALNKIWAL